MLKLYKVIADLLLLYLARQHRPLLVQGQAM